MDLPTVYVVWKSALAALLSWLSILYLYARGIGRGPRSDSAAVLPNEANTEVVVTLVHGTAGWFSSWLKVDSGLRRKISAAYGNQVVYRRVNWSGWNSFRARRLGAATLVNQIDLNVEQWPTAKQVIIAHSHGGSLTIEALNNDSCARKVDRVICMATPFLTITRFKLASSSRAVQTLFDFGGVYAGLIVILFAFQWIAPTGTAYIVDQFETFRRQAVIPPGAIERFIATREISFMSFAAYQFLYVIAPVSLFFLMLWLIRRIANHYEKIVCTALVDIKFDADRILILRQPGDEASGAIGGLHAASWPLGVLIRLICAVFLPLDSARRRARATRFGRFWTGWLGFASVGLATALIVQTANLGSIGSVRYFAIELVTSTVATAILVCGWAMFAFFAVALSVATIVALAYLISLIPACFSVGPEMLFAGSRLKVTAEGSPIGNWRVITVPMRASLKRDLPLFGSLWHSYLYESEEALSQMVAWLKTQRLCA